MTIQWLASKRVEGLDADKDTIPVNSLENGYSFTSLDTPQEYIWNGVDTWVPIGGVTPTVITGWRELGRGTLQTPADVIDVLGFADKRYLMVLSHSIPTVGTTKIQFNHRFGSLGVIDSGLNYANRYSQDGATDITGINQNGAQTGSGIEQDAEQFGVMFIANQSDKEKLVLSHNVSQSSVGAASAPIRGQAVSKHVQTSNPLNSVQLLNTEVGDYDVGSQVVVLGYDPSDTGGTNFWEELDSVTLEGAGLLNTNSFAAKKYLWVQMYLKPSGSSAVCDLRFNNDSTVSYAGRRSTNGGADVVDTSDTSHIINVTSNATKLINMYIVNNTTEEKLAIYSYVDQNSSGAGNVPDRRKGVMKWTDTASQINQIRCTSANVGIGSQVKVWGSN